MVGFSLGVVQMALYVKYKNGSTRRQKLHQVVVLDEEPQILKINAELQVWCPCINISLNNTQSFLSLHVFFLYFTVYVYKFFDDQHHYALGAHWVNHATLIYIVYLLVVNTMIGSIFLWLIMSKDSIATQIYDHVIGKYDMPML